jgi:hypothetical protein
MSRSLLSRRAAAGTVLASIVTAGLVATADPAAAIPFEGDASPTRCVRVLALPDAAPAGSSLFPSHGYVAVLVPRWGC